MERQIIGAGTWGYAVIEFQVSEWGTRVPNILKHLFLDGQIAVVDPKTTKILADSVVSKRREIHNRKGRRNMHVMRTKREFLKDIREYNAEY